MTVSVVALQPGIALTGTLAAVCAPSVGSTALNGWASNNGSSAATLAMSISRAGAAAMPLVPAMVVAPMSSVAVPQLSNFALSNGDTLLASGAGIGLFINGFQVTA